MPTATTSCTKITTSSKLEARYPSYVAAEKLLPQDRRQLSRFHRHPQKAFQQCLRAVPVKPQVGISSRIPTLLGPVRRFLRCCQILHDARRHALPPSIVTPVSSAMLLSSSSKG